MFGYVRTDIPNMYVKDTVLYKAMYCGLCKSIGKTCGNCGRFTLNYDLTFLSVFLHNLLDLDVKIEKQRCILHHIRKRPVAVPDELSKKIACFNVILAYYKLTDDILDVGKGRTKRNFIKSSYKKAKKYTPELDLIVGEMYDGLRVYEKTNGDSIDISADYFGNMMANAVRFLLGEVFNEQIGSLSYNVGKWVYLIDALDDFDKDKKKGNFNVFVNLFSNIKDKESLIEEKSGEIIPIFATILQEIKCLSSQMNYKFNHDLTDNILLYGLKEQTKKVMEGKKCKKTTKY